MIDLTVIWASIIGLALTIWPLVKQWIVATT